MEEKTLELRKVEALENIAAALRLLAINEYSDLENIEQIRNTWRNPGDGFLPNKIEFKSLLRALGSNDDPRS